MAIIKCPECGHQISDKAPVCPSCGVQIAGHIIKCPNCGDVYFKDQPACPNCHYVPQQNVQPKAPVNEPQMHEPAQQATSAPVQPAPQRPVTPQSTATPQRPVTAQRPTTPQHTTTPPVPPVTTPGNTTEKPGDDKPQPKKSKTMLIVSLCIALLLCGVFLYAYKDAQTDKENDAYEFALNSSDSTVLKDYLDKYPDAPEAHITAITEHLMQLRQGDTEWTNALMSNSKSALQAYLDSHPDTPHKSEIMHKIDSIDWAQASSENTLDALQAYLSDHANGDHVDEAQAAIKQLKTKTVTPEEQMQAQAVIRQFFQSINAHSESSLLNTLNATLTSFLGRSNATSQDAVDFMNKQYKENVASIVWRCSGFKVSKREVGDEQYEYTVNFNAVQEVKHSDETPEKVSTYRSVFKVSPEGLISSADFTKISNE